METPTCAAYAVEAGLHALRELGAERFERLAYSDSYKEYPDGSPPSRVVGYGSGVFLAGAGPSSFTADPGRERKKELLALARRSLEASFAETAPPPPPELAEDPFFNLPAALFVTLKKSGALRGCIGNVMPSYTLRDAVVKNSLAAAFEDPRFPPLAADELPLIKLEISLLSPLEKAAGHAAVKPGVHGVMLAQNGRSGLFLPQVWEQLPSKEYFLGELCSQKAKLPRDCWKDRSTEFYLFTSDSFEE